MTGRKFGRIEKQGPGKFFPLLLFLLSILMLTNCKTADYKDGYEKGYKKGDKMGYVRGYREAKHHWYKKGKEEGHQKGKEEGYEKGKKEGYENGTKDGYKIGFSRGEQKGYWKGTKAFIEEWWKPSLGFVIILLGSIFIFLVLFLLIKKRMKRFAEQVAGTIEHLRVSQKMERLIREKSPKKNKSSNKMKKKEKKNEHR